MTTVTITNLRGDHERISLPAPLWEGRHPIGPGVTLQALYRGPRTGRLFARTDSIWEDNGRCVGTEYAELTVDQYLHHCDRVDIEPVGVAPTEV